MRKQSFTVHFEAPPETVYKAMLDPALLPKWRVPDEMSMEVHHFEPVPGGKFRISLSYDDPANSGKSGKNTDTYHGYFKSLVPYQKIIEVLEFESADPNLAGQMTITTELSPENGGTKMTATHENLPAVVPEDQNEIGWKMTLAKLASLLQT